ncbi:MAG: hypothetical protein IJM34_09490 [Lachnospiraceae bacterium]|nr:hypothetical protein [Lachnospiraceae bacterium]
MASIFSAAKQMINKISDEVNKDKWDKSCINQALFTDPEPGKMVPPSRQDSRPVPPEKTSNVQPAIVPPQADMSAQAVNVAAATTAADNAASFVAAAPQIEYSTDKPQVKQSISAAESEKKDSVKFINSRFNRSINYVTSKVVKPANGVRSINDLPVIDPSQSISNISGMTLGAGGEPVYEEKPVAEPAVAEAPKSAAPVQQQSPSQPSPAVAAAMAAQQQTAASQPSPAVAAAMAAQQQSAASQPSPAVAAAMAAQQQMASQPAAPQTVVAQPVVSQPAAASQPSPAVAAAMAAQQQMASQPAAPQIVVAQPVVSQPAAASQPSPAVAAAMLAAAQLAAVQQSAPAGMVPPVMVQPVQITEQVPVMTQAAPPVMSSVQVQPAEAAPAELQIPEYQEEAPAEGAAAAEEETDKCYYVLITHTKTQPAEGKCVLMRNCDFQYAWTDSMAESEKPSYDTCPVCGKPIEYIETEMD